MIKLSTLRAMSALSICLVAIACGEEVESTHTSTSALTKGQPGAAIGDQNYCSDPNNLCDIGEGACGRHSQCTTGLKCAPRGEIYGLPGLRVCVPAHCVNSRREASLGEVGVDCGGVCGPCASSDTCYNGTLDGDEESIDCGGTGCEPCADVLLTVNSPTSQSVYTPGLAARVAGRVETSSPDQRGNRQVSFLLDGVSVGSTLTRSNGSWDFRLPTRPPGLYTLSTTVENGAFIDSDQRQYRIIYSNGSYAFGQLLSGGRSSSTAARAVAFGPQDSIFTAGVVALDLTYGSDTITRSPSQGIVGYVSHAQADGTPLWVTRLGGDTTAAVNEIKTLSSGDVIAFGEFSGTIDLGSGPVTAAGTQDAFLVRLSASTGQVVWSKTLSVSASASTRRLAITPQDDIILTANYKGTVNLSGAPLASQGNGTDIYVARVSADGTHQWSRSYGDEANDTVNDVDIDAEGNIYLVGSYQKGLTIGTTTLSSPLTTSAFLAKLTPSGGVISLRDIGGNSYDAAVRVSVGPQGEVVVTGVFSGNTNFGGATFTATDDFDIFLVSYNSAGVHQWSRQIIAEPGALINSMEVSDTGRIIVAGLTRDPINLGVGLLTPRDSIEGFMGVYNSQGLLISQRFLTSGRALTPRGLAISPLNAYAIVGDLQGTEARLGGTPLTHEARRSGFLALYR